VTQTLDMTITADSLFISIDSDIALKFKESNGLPGLEIRQSHRIFRCLRLPDFYQCQTFANRNYGKQ